MSTRTDDPTASIEADAGSWRDTVLAGLANYIDGGSIVAGAAGLTLWADEYGFGSTFTGVVAAFSSNAISAGVGALVGGYLCDRFGRKRIYQWDMLLYAFGVAWIVFAAAPWMLVLGYVLAGLAVGADVPASWTLIAESAPGRRRGRHAGVAQMLWYAGPVVVLLMTLALSSLGVLGIRIVFAHLLVVALVLWALRRGMAESRTWTEARSAAADASTSIGAVLRQLAVPRYLAPLLFLMGMYGVWNLFAGTNGFFLPYILRTVGTASQASSVATQCAVFAISIAAIGLVFMPFVDRVNQRALFAVAAFIQVVGVGLFALFSLNLPVVLAYVVLIGIGQGLGQQSFFQLWSSELFPTLVRTTAQGLMFAVVRIGLGVWSFFVPTLTAGTGFHAVAWILTGFVLFSAVVGTVWAPANQGLTLAEIHDRPPSLRERLSRPGGPARG